MKNGLTKFLLLIDYHGEYHLKLDNIVTQQHIYKNIDAYEMVSQIACEIPQEIIEPLQPENNNLKEEIKKLKKENDLLKRDNVGVPFSWNRMYDEKLEEIITLEDLCVSLEAQIKELEERFFIEKNRADVAVLRLDDEMKQQIHLLNEVK
tara:strand:+ start:6482 stop:6931 length:450 start_codon:yes stop_codon:yes gene_type:complete